MRVYGTHSILRVDGAGMDYCLTACGYPIREHMDKWAWKDWDAMKEGDILVQEEEYLEMECKLKGIHAKDLNPPHTHKYEKQDDDMYNEYIEYLEQQTEPA